MGPRPTVTRSHSPAWPPVRPTTRRSRYRLSHPVAKILIVEKVADLRRIISVRRRLVTRSYAEGLAVGSAPADASSPAAGLASGSAPADASSATAGLASGSAPADTSSAAASVPSVSAPPEGTAGGEDQKLSAKTAAIKTAREARMKRDFLFRRQTAQTAPLPTEGNGDP